MAHIPLSYKPALTGACGHRLTIVPNSTVEGKWYLALECVPCSNPYEPISYDFNTLAEARAAIPAHLKELSC